MSFRHDDDARLSCPRCGTRQCPAFWLGRRGVSYSVEEMDAALQTCSDRLTVTNALKASIVRGRPPTHRLLTGEPPF